MPDQPFSRGMCSVTLRDEPVQRVLEVAVAAGLACIEWGGDVHVPAGDTRAAATTRAACEDAGIRVASYGSYFLRVDKPADADFAPVLASAVVLGAPRIRIWAGGTGSADATPEHRAAVVGATRAAAARAEDAGVDLAFEYHGGTLTDTAESTERLLHEVDRPAVSTYWQPPVAAPDEQAVAGLERVLPWVSAVHVFSWWPERQRLPLSARASLWRAVFDVLRRTGRPYDALLEFVSNADPDQVVVDAGTLDEFTQRPR